MSQRRDGDGGDASGTVGRGPLAAESAEGIDRVEGIDQFEWTPAVDGNGTGGGTRQRGPLPAPDLVGAERISALRGRGELLGREDAPELLCFLAGDELAVVGEDEVLVGAVAHQEGGGGGVLEGGEQAIPATQRERRLAIVTDADSSDLAWSVASFKLGKNVHVLLLAWPLETTRPFVV